MWCVNDCYNVKCAMVILHIFFSCIFCLYGFRIVTVYCLTGWLHWLTKLKLIIVWSYFVIDKLNLNIRPWKGIILTYGATLPTTTKFQHRCQRLIYSVQVKCFENICHCFNLSFSGQAETFVALVSLLRNTSAIDLQIQK